MEKPDDLVWIASFDIGKKNFAFCIEEVDRSSLLGIKNVPKLQRYNPDGTATPAFENVLSKVSTNGKIILFKNSDLTSNCTTQYLDPETFHNMVDVLDEYAEYWDNCIAFVIEQQMGFGKNRNTMALKLGQHCYSYFIFKYSRFKEVIDFPAYHKTQVLGAQKLTCKTKKGKNTYKAIDKPTRKKWSVVKATEILTVRGEENVLTSLKTVRKKDDLCDCLLQGIAFRYLMFVDKSI